MNDDEQWFRELAQVAKDEQQAAEARFDERWDRLSAGDLSAEEEAALRELAAGSEEGRAAYEAFRPLGPAFQARVVQALREQGSAPAAPAPAPRVLPFRRRGLQIGGWLTAAASIAAALILLLRPEALPPLPDYREPELSGGTHTVRANPDELGDFVPGSPFSLVVTPQTAVAGKVMARCFLARGTELRPWPVRPQISPAGTVRIAGTVGREIVIPPGTWTLWVVVGRPKALPDAAALRARLARGETRTPGWVALKKPVKIE